MSRQDPGFNTQQSGIEESNVGLATRMTQPTNCSGEIAVINNEGGLRGNDNITYRVRFVYTNVCPSSICAIF